MGRTLNKFLLLMWKNWILQYRKPIQTIIEIVAPVIFSILLVLIRSLVDPKPHDDAIFKSFSPLFPDKLLGRRNLFDDYKSANKTLIFAPNNSVTNNIMSPFSNFPNVETKVFEDIGSMEQFYIASGSQSVFAGIKFDDKIANKTGKDKINVDIRFPAELRSANNTFDATDWRTYLVYPIFQTAGPRSPSYDTGGTPNYNNEGFLTLQYLLSLLIILDKNGIDLSNVTFNNFDELPDISNFSFIDIQMRRFPYAAWQDDPLLTPLKSFVGVIVMLSFVYTCINTVKAITAEKEKQLKEAMKIMGLPNWLHWTAWFVKSLSYLMVSIILMVILLKVRWYKNTNFTVFTYANPLVLLLFLFCYVCATITFCFLISVFFSKANTAATVAGLAWFVSYAPYLFLQQNYESLKYSTKIMTSFCSNTAMAYGFQIMLMFEGTGDGVQFSNIFHTNTPDDSLTLGVVMIMLIADSLIYLILALYVEAVFPGDYGIPLPWNFFCLGSYWTGEPQYKGVEDSTLESNEEEFFESEPKNLEAGIVIKNLQKVFGKKTAVRNLTLNMYKDQITVLLGHNGAGKTTTMSMLTGMFPPTSGTAIINDYDIRMNIDGVRNSLGLCPQHNIIFDELTVAEHFYFFSKLKGMRASDIPAEIDKYVNLLDLVPKKDKKSSTLSGGMKRKLCVGIALCGNSKVVMLDEPTAGMDPSARRVLWDLILKLKSGRTILLTTHFMDEADLLGDRIAIMAGGKLQCCGTSFFLKKKYGAGYHLIMDKSNLCDPEKVTNLLRKHIPDIQVHSNIGSELTYLLVESQSYLFETMLEDLESHSQSLHINSYGISLTTLEEVFMKVGADHGQEELYDNNSVCVDITRSNKNIPLSPDPLNSFEVIRNQFMAMTLKKTVSIIRNWKLLLIQISIPVLFLIITLVVAENQGNLGNLPSMPLDLSKFANPVIVLQSNNSQCSEMEKQYRALVDGHIEETSNITESMLQLTRENPAKFKVNYVAGATFDSCSPFSHPFSKMTAYFNNDPYHTPAIALGLALNTMHSMNFDDCTNCGVEYNNYPFPFDIQSEMKKIATGNNMGFQLAFNIGFGLAFVSSFYVLFIVRERVSKSKHLQYVSGVNAAVFWSTTFLWDFLTYLLNVISVIIVLLCFQEDGFKTFAELGRLTLILIYFGVAMLPVQYIAAAIFDVPSTGYTRMTLFSIFTGVAAFLIIQILSASELDLEYIADALHWVFLAVPHYSLATGIRDTSTMYYTVQLCDKIMSNCKEYCPNCTSQDECLDYFHLDRSYCAGIDGHYLKWETPGIGRNLLYSFGVSVILFILILLVEFEVHSKIIFLINQKYFAKGPQPVEDEDDDVVKEKYEIRNKTQNELFRHYTLVLKDLTKYYNNFLAVNGLCLGVKKYECFGLLGVNGAGKTTTFKMLTGDVKISHGDAWINGNSINHNLEEVQKLVGYCPQFDALLDDMTARETLIMFALLRGIKRANCNAVAEKLAIDFDFYRHLDKQVRELSGGNKRKLSTATSLIGDPPVIYLDEPTTGMDPATKRFLWNDLCQVRDSGKTIILTSHSMEECEALCTKLAIMVNGNFKCLGSTQHLKNKFAEGYTITIKIKKPDDSSGFSHSNTDQIERYINENFSQAILREKHEELLTYYVTDKSVTWSKMFGILERGKRSGDLDIEDYSLGQSSLEQVFLTFTKHQN